MRRRIGIVAVFALALLLGSLAVAPAQVLNAITPYLLQSRAWTFTALQTFTAGLTSIGATINAAQNLSMSAPANPPTNPTTSGVSGGCLTSRQYRFYKAWVNQSGISALGPASSPDFTPGTNSRKTTITFADEAPPANAVGVALYYSASNDSHAAKKACALGALANTMVATGTTTFDCACQGTSTTAGTTGVVSYTKLGYQGDIRAAVEATTIDKTATVDKNRLRLSTTPPAWSPDSGVTYADFYILGPNTKTVCAAGCDYTTLTLAYAGITDASSSKVYNILFDGQETTAITLKSYTNLIGVSPESSQTGNITIPIDGTGVSISNVTVATSAGTIPISYSSSGSYVSRTTLRVDNVFCGSADFTAVDCLVDINGPARDVVFRRVTMRSQWDTIILGSGSRFWDFGCKWEMTEASASASTPRGWNWEQGGMLGVEVRSYDADFNVTLANNGSSFIGLNIDDHASTPPGAAWVELHNPSFNVNVTAAAWTGFATCVQLKAVAANAFANTVNVYNMSCRMKAGASGTLKGIDVATVDADRSTWALNVFGGKIDLTGGATKTDINQSETTAGFTATVAGTQTGGVYAGAGQILGTAIHAGGKTYQFPLATAPATCAIGERYFDTSGADCVCKSANTWEIANATGSCV